MYDAIIVKNTTKRKPMREETIVKECDEYISKHLFSDKITLEDMAKEMNYNPSYLSRTYKKVTGQNVMKRFREKRMEKAEELLRSGMSVIEVATYMGYSKNGFTKAYKAVMGINPSCVIKQDKGE